MVNIKPIGDTSPKLAAGSLLLILPVPSLAVLFGMRLYPDTLLGQILFSAGKLWVLIVPVLWILYVEHKRISLPPLRCTGMLTALSSGLLIAFIIYMTYASLSREHINITALRKVAAQVGLDDKGHYILLTLYWVMINSLLEEYLWRWFVVRQCRRLMSALWAMMVAAAGFTLHHIVAMQLYFEPFIVVLATLGVFCGGLIWSWMRVYYRSIWPGYISHAIADIALFTIGYRILFD